MEEPKKECPPHDWNVCTGHTPFRKFGKLVYWVECWKCGKKIYTKSLEDAHEISASNN